MSEKPLGRDRLGRLVYRGDVVEWGEVVYGDSDGFTVAFIQDGRLYDLRCPADQMTVDLATSPKRTNWERYFADLGTAEEVKSYVIRSCDETPTIDCDEEGCPFALWGADCRHSFRRWLQQEATV